MPGYDSQRLGYVLTARRQRRAQEFQQHQADRSLTIDQPPSVQQVIRFDSLLNAYQRLQRNGGQAPGPDGVTYDSLGHREVCTVLRKLSQELQDGRYRSSQALGIKIPKPAGGTRRLRLRSILHRVVASALQQAMTPYWESQFLDVSHGFRPRRNVRTLMQNLEHQILQQHRTVIATADIRQAFDTVHLQDIINAHHHFIQDQPLLDLVETVLADPHSHRRQGIDQGNPYSPMALNVVLHHHLDVIIQQAAEHPLLLRYADDLTIPADSVSECHEVLNKVRCLLEPLGLDLTCKEGPPVDLGQEGQAVNVLGLELHLKDGRLVYGIPENAWKELKQGLLEAQLDACPSRMARQMCQGWLQGYGLALENVQEQELMEKIQRILGTMGFREISNRDIFGWITSTQGGKQGSLRNNPKGKQNDEP